MTNPIWMPAPGYEGIYEVSDNGLVRSWYMGGNKRKDPRIKKPQLNKNGYLYVLLSFKKRIKAWAVHRLVLSSFTGTKPSNIDACHNNGLRYDNRLSNLRWATRKENEADKILHGTKAIGDRNGMRKNA